MTEEEGEREYPVILESPDDSQLVVTRLLQPLRFEEFGRMSLRKKTLDDERSMGGHVLDEDERKRRKAHDEREKRRAASGNLRRPRRKREASIEQVTDWMLECEYDDPAVDRKLFTGRREHSREVNPYVLLLEEDDCFYVCPVRPQWYNFKPAVVVSSVLDEEDEEGGEGEEGHTRRRTRSRNPHQQRGSGSILNEGPLTVTGTRTGKRKMPKVKSRLSSKLEDRLTFVKSIDARLKSEMQREQEIVAEEAAFQAAAETESWDFDLSESRYVNDETLIPDYAADAMHEGKFQTEPKGYADLGQDEAEILGELEDIEKAMAENEQNRLEGVLKRAREGRLANDGEPPEKKRKGPDGEPIPVDTPTTPVKSEEEVRFEILEQRVVQFVRQKGQCSATDLLRHLRMKVTRTMTPDQKRDYETLKRVITKNLTRKENVLFLKQQPQ